MIGKELHDAFNAHSIDIISGIEHLERVGEAGMEYVGKGRVVSHSMVASFCELRAALHRCAVAFGLMAQEMEHESKKRTAPTTGEEGKP